MAKTLDQLREALELDIERMQRGEGTETTAANIERANSYLTNAIRGEIGRTDSLRLMGEGKVPSNPFFDNTATATTRTAGMVQRVA